MKQEHIIVSENNRPFWQLPVAALFFTAAIALLLYTFISINWKTENIRGVFSNFQNVFFLGFIGLGFCSQKRIHIDLKNSKFRPTIEIGNLKFGKWSQINDYEYVSVFHQPFTNGDYTFEVNLWYDRNKHFELYSKDSFEDAMEIGYSLSEELNIDLLDATIPNDYKWINKEELKQNANG